jgi:hypothetical protein
MSRRTCEQEILNADGSVRICGKAVPAYRRFCDECASKREADRMRFKNRRARQRPRNAYDPNGVSQKHTKSAECADAFQSGDVDFISPFDEAERWAREARGGA